MREWSWDRFLARVIGVGERVSRDLERRRGK